MRRIPAESVAGMIRRPVHVRWAKAGCVWIVLKVEQSAVILMTPKTGKTMRVKLTDLCYVRSDTGARKVEE